MSSASTIDLETVLAPIPGAHPAGENLRYAGPYDAIQEARRADDGLDQGAWVCEAKRADWSAVIALATQALATRSKDLQIAVWLVEALGQRHGFAGLRDGLGLLGALQERFWETLYPEVVDDDLEYRTAPLAWLNEKLPPCIRQLPVTQGVHGELYTWRDWDTSRTVDNLGRRSPEARQAALTDGKISGEQFDKAVETTPLAYYRQLSEDIQDCRAACAQLTREVDARYGAEAPGLLGISAALEDCHSLVAGILQRRGGGLEPVETTAEPEPAQGVLEPWFHSNGNGARVADADASLQEPDVPTALPPEPSRAPQNRAEALQRLAALAAYFRRHEPHSPVSYMVQRAVRWGDMPLEVWLQYVIHDEAVLDRVRETLGLHDAASSTTDA